MLVAAFALSLLVHALLAVLYHSTAVTPSAVSNRFYLGPIPPREVRPRPTPHPPAPHRTPGIAVPHVVARRVRSRAPFAQTSPAAPAAGSTTAPPPPHARCTAPNAPAAIAVAASPPEIPPGVRAQDISAVAAVQVSLDANGAVTGAEIAQSTRSPSFDAFALQMARETQYVPAHRACAGIASEYLFRVQFSAW